MLNYTYVNKFLKENPNGYIRLVQSDCVFDLVSNMPYSLDETSITLLGAYYTEKKCGNVYTRRGNFVIPFEQIIRIEYIKADWEE